MNPKNEIIGAFILLVLVSIIFSTVDSTDQTLINGVSYYGSICSVFGLIIAYLQIRKIRTSTEETKKGIIGQYQGYSDTKGCLWIR